MLAGIWDETKFVYQVAKGEIAKDLEKRKTEAQQQQARLSSLESSIQQIKEPDREAILQKYFQAAKAYNQFKSDLNKAIKQHNDLAKAIRKYSLGFYDPPQVGLAGLQLLPIAAIVAASGVALFALATLVDSLRTTANRSKGFIQDTADAIKAVGGTVTAFSKTAWAVGGLIVIVGGFIAFQDWRKSKRSSLGSAKTFPMTKIKVTPKGLKPVRGEVIS